MLRAVGPVAQRCNKWKVLARPLTTIKTTTGASAGLLRAHAQTSLNSYSSTAAVAAPSKLALGHSAKLSTTASTAAATAQQQHEDESTTIAGVTAWVKDDPRLVTVQFDDGLTSTYNSIWLRDHCRCSSCFHSVTKQRLLDTSSIPLDIAPTTMAISSDGTTIKFVWQDGHESLLDVAWLRAHSYSPQLPPPSSSSNVNSHTPQPRQKKLWKSDLASRLESVTVPFDQVMSSTNNDQGLAEWLLHLDVHGIGLVSGVPATPQATEQLARRIAFIRETHYGGFWDFTADLAHGDTAYTNLALPAHTDTTYFTDPCGLQMFHLLEHDGTGGDSLFVDGFSVAQQLKEKYPAAYHTLSTTPLMAHSAGDPATFIQPAAAKPILNHHLHPDLLPTPGGPSNRRDIPRSRYTPSNLSQIRFNNDDRSPFIPASSTQNSSGVPSTIVQSFYTALKHWTDLLRSPSNELWLKLEPGTAVMFDNWRVLHGRASFTGKRRLCGAYINWDDYQSRIRTVLDRDSL
ncbi:mitochondrial protein [Phlyctochytrium arcticum]|nr:mitochondrial protein [Phlyctochytrium arcticum]